MSRRVQHADPRALTDALGAAMGAGDEWRLVTRGHSPALESVLAVGNGFLGLRGTPEEGAPAHDAGTIVNGFHETWPIVYPEDAFGLARTGQTMLACPDGSVVRLTADGEALDVSGAVRALDMRRGVLTREVSFVTGRGRRVVVRSTRLASLVDPAPGGDQLRGARPRRRRDRDLLGAGHARPAPRTATTPGAAKGFAENPLVSEGAALPRLARRARAGDPQQRAAARVRHGPPRHAAPSG